MIVAIGGGQIKSKSTYEIDKYIISSVNKPNKKVLLIPIASKDNEVYVENFKKYYEEFESVTVDTLLLSFSENDNLIRSKIFTSDIIYIGGGNTGKLLRVFKRCRINEYLMQALEKGIVLVGISAGAMPFFQFGYTDANRSTDVNAPLSLIKGFNYLPYCFCPHYNEEERKSFDNFVVVNNLNGLAIEDDTAIIFENQNISKIIGKGAAYSFLNDMKQEIKK